MSKRKAVAGVLWGIAAVVFISGFGATSAGTKPYDAGLMASWVQAVGAITAIGAGAWFIHYQNDLARRRRRIAIASMLDVALDVMAAGGYVPKDGMAAAGSLVFFNSHRFEVIHRALLAIPMHEIEPATHIVLIEEAIEILRKAARHSEAMESIVRDKNTESVGNAHIAGFERLSAIRRTFDPS